MYWKNKLKAVLAKQAKTEKTEICLEKTLTKADKTSLESVSSVFVSSEFRHIPEISPKSKISPNCSNCDLEMIFVENENIWFCPLGCESRKAI